MNMSREDATAHELFAIKKMCIEVQQQQNSTHAPSISENMHE